MRTERVYLDGIETLERLRPLHTDRVSALKSSIEEIGLRTPLTVMAKADGDDTRMILVAGHHRLEALRQIGEEATECFVIDDDEIDAKLWEIDENLMRATLSASEEAAHLKRRKELWEARRSSLNSGTTCSENTRGRPAEFASETADLTGETKQSINRKVARADAVCDEAMRLVVGTKLDRGTYLDSLKTLSHTDQVAKVKKDLEEPKPSVTSQSNQTRNSSRIDADVKARAAKEVAEIIAEHVPGEWWDAVKSNLYASGAKNIADQLSNITGQSIMDRRYA